MLYALLMIVYSSCGVGMKVSEALIEADDVDLQDDRQITEWTEQRLALTLS